MISYIKGTVEYAGADFAIIECGGIGYRVRMPLSQLTALPHMGTEAKVFTYMYIREDILDLYGFMSEEALKIFEMLISVNGVGPKAGLSILSAYSAQELGVLISTGDHKAIAKAQGIGAKTAQRVVLELKDKIGKTGADTADFEESPSASSNALNEAISALAALGYSYNESKAALGGAQGETTEELIKYALKRLAL